jgi:hypothetical protein
MRNVNIEMKVIADIPKKNDEIGWTRVILLGM